MLAEPVAIVARPAPRSRALTLLAWLLCALLGPGPALPALHYAVVAHRVCLEHGALEHVGADGVVADGVVADGVVADGVVADGVVAEAASARKTTPDAGQAVTSGRGAAEDHGHEACGVAGVGGSVALLPAPPAGVAALRLPSTAAPSGVERAHPSIALLSYAPKLAPPAPA